MNMLSPKKTKFRKQFKGRIHGSAKGLYLGVKRMSRCHPIKTLGGNSGLDFVPKKETVRKKN